MDTKIEASTHLPHYKNNFYKLCSFKKWKYEQKIIKALIHNILRTKEFYIV